MVVFGIGVKLDFVDGDEIGIDYWYCFGGGDLILYLFGDDVFFVCDQCYD